MFLKNFEAYSMTKSIRYYFGKGVSKTLSGVLKVLPTGGKSLPGLFFIKLSGWDSVKELSENQVEKGSILITGTNGKTTTTTMMIDLFSIDSKLSSSVGNNTVFALTTSLLDNPGEIGVFEYGIRDIKHGLPDTVSTYINPKCVVYTNISREHTQVAGVKNPFEDYLKAKTLLSKAVKDGMIITNADDPNTTYIGLNKEKDNNHIIYYGFNLESLNDIFDGATVKCPKCGKQLEYSKYYMNQRGLYSCTCGFKRPKPDVELTRFEEQDGKWLIQIKGNTYNYQTKENIPIDTTFKVPPFGIHNLYNILCAVTTYASFTPVPENIEENVTNYYNNLKMEILPPGRFEIIPFEGKTVGVGQGDNGDALKVNLLLMNSYIDDTLEFIYTTPDANEEEIFEDHKDAIEKLNPNKLVVLPGRTSIEAAQEYYNQIQEEFTSEFYPLEFDFETRINKIIDLVRKSDCKYVIITGCGEEIDLWEGIKKKLKK